MSDEDTQTADGDARDATVPNGERHPDAWNRTVTDMGAIAEAREEEEGWDVVVLEPHRTIPLGDDDKLYDVFGFLHSVDDEEAIDAFEEVFARSTFPRYEVYRTQVEDSVFFVTELFDGAAETAVLIAGRYEIEAAVDMLEAAKREGELYTHIETPDEEIAGAVQHDGFEKFVPEEELEELDINASDL